MARTFVFGAGGHARVIASLISADEIAFVVPEPVAADQIAEAMFFERIDDFAAADIYLGIGDNAIRRRIFERLIGLGVIPAICVAPNAFVARTASLGPGAVVCPGGAVMDRARLGANVIVNTLSGVDHDCVIGDHSQITAGVTLGGTVTLGERCFLGIKSAVLPNLRLGDNVTVMAGSLVVNDIGDNVMVGGSPARIVRNL
jgi:sugar O-acyltransferase (sialic acid O-acetyltransferase NeuD family)